MLLLSLSDILIVPRENNKFQYYQRSTLFRNGSPLIVRHVLFSMMLVVTQYHCDSASEPVEIEISLYYRHPHLTRHSVDPVAWRLS